ncbi:hypothetical protein HDIA_3839 [Hartmannibacter diazotrophicus]|uniref:DUF3095 domain-containing protein n=1 Tax=Hartmannibacter diazotrophicus TaxID=1482074 RepID=A0A2C9DB34_9HYPH|nr:DUF3095 family protein [Hartmannibacter diazotrophicus]SON57380.1 hypothetical protein HDIA_3839 [Hartmannibacter diazotrophicus]
MEPDNRDTSFFAAIPSVANPASTFDLSRFRSAPDDWLMVQTDVRDSTSATAGGMQRTINFIAVATIAALRNLHDRITLPFQFGGDGVTVLIPDDRREAAMALLARLRGLARREFQLELRVGILPVSRLRQHGVDVSIARYEPTPGNNFAVFRGDGAELMEAALKGRAAPDLGAAMQIDESLDDGEAIDLTGLSCRWDPLHSTRGKIVSLLVRSKDDLGAAYADVLRITGRDGDPRAVQRANLKPHWPPRALLVEARTTRGRLPVAVKALEIMAISLFTLLLIRWNITVGGFKPSAYLDDTVTNTDFCSHDDTFGLVLDCSPQTIDELRTMLERRRAAGELAYGLHTSETALITCLVSSVTTGLHVHFVDGGDGGYTSASRGLKAIAA